MKKLQQIPTFVIAAATVFGANILYAGNAVPRYDPEAYCDSLYLVFTTMAECLEEERAQRDAIAPRWARTPVEVQDYCNRVYARTQGMGSYGALLHCIEKTPEEFRELTDPTPVAADGQTQAAFEAIVTKWRDAYAAADPELAADQFQRSDRELARSGMTAARDREFCRTMPVDETDEFGVTGWTGTVSSIKASPDGAMVFVRLLPYLTIGTAALGVKRKDAVYPVIRTLAEGQRIRFSGFFPEIVEGECFSATRFFESDRMMDPDFNFTFTAIEPLP